MSDGGFSIVLSRKEKVRMNKLFSVHQWEYRGVLVTMLFAILLVVGVLSFAPAAHAASSTQTLSAPRSAVVPPAIINRCQEGFACFYPGTGWNGGHPTQEWYNYGTYRIFNWTGNHRVFNNQTGGAVFWLCTDDYGNNCPKRFAEDQSGVVNLTPYNSVKLTP